jgi:hypothetical protein
MATGMEMEMVVEIVATRPAVDRIKMFRLTHSGSSLQASLQDCTLKSNSKKDVNV